MSPQFTLQGMLINVQFKRIKNMYLRVKAPDGRIEITAPQRTSMRRIHAFAKSKLKWIKQRQEQLKLRLEEETKYFTDGERHQLWGQTYSLENVVSAHRSSVEVIDHVLRLPAPADADIAKKNAILEAWYRQQVREAARPLIAKWEIKMGLKVSRLYVRRMKTLWGSCTIKKRSIRLNTELAKRKPECLEYLIVHEMTHLLEASHNHRFYALMDSFMPNWKSIRESLKNKSLDIY